MVEAKAKARGLRGQGKGQGHKILFSRSRRVLEDPHTRAFLLRDTTQRAVMPSHLSVHHSQRPSAASCALVYEVLYFWYWVLYLLTIFKNSTSYGRISKPKSRPRIVEAKAKARDLRGQSQGQGQGSSRPRPRPQIFVLEVSSRSRPVLEDPIPATQSSKARIRGAEMLIIVGMTRLGNYTDGVNWLCRRQNYIG